MNKFYAIDTTQGLNGAIASFLGDLLEKGGLDAVMVPCELPYKETRCKRWFNPSRPSGPRRISAGRKPPGRKSGPSAPRQCRCYSRDRRDLDGAS